jgi:MFS family permease
LTYFGLDIASNATQLIGAINGLYQAGGLIGTLCVGFLGDHLGRKKALFYCSSLCVVGGALQCGSVHIAMFMVARFLTGFCIGTIPSAASVELYSR